MIDEPTRAGALRLGTELLMALLATVATSNAAAADCTAQTRLDVTTIEPQIVLVGEAHGTNELPGFTAGLVCSYLKAGRSVILAVEQDGDEQEALNRYVRSADSATDRAALLEGRTWKRYSDGRGSAAMLELIESMRRLRQAGERVGILAFRRNENLDVPMDAADKAMLTPADNVLQNRIADLDMANALQYAAILYRRYVVVALTGHSYTRQGYAGDPTFKPMGLLLKEQVPTYIVAFETGGGVHAFMGRDRPIAAGPLFGSDDIVDATVRIDRLTASPPARDGMPR